MESTQEGRMLEVLCLLSMNRKKFGLEPKFMAMNVNTIYSNLCDPVSDVILFHSLTI